MIDESLIEMLNDINTRSLGNYETMSVSDRIACVEIMKELKDNLDKWLNENYTTISVWAGLSLDDILKDKQLNY